MNYLSESEKILILIGPSAVGKSTIINSLYNYNLIDVTPIWTTRAKRTNEYTNTPEHKFVSDLEFDQLKVNNYFLETVSHFGLQRYGVSKIISPRQNHLPTIILRADYVSLFQKHYANTVVYQIECSYQDAKNRLIKRELSKNEIDARMKEFNKELKLGSKIADSIFMNIDIDQTINEIRGCLVKDFKIK